MGIELSQRLFNVTIKNYVVIIENCGINVYRIVTSYIRQFEAKIGNYDLITGTVISQWGSVYYQNVKF